MHPVYPNLFQKASLICLISIASITLCYGQTGLTISPEKPKAGEPIQITYTPSGNLAGKPGKVEAVFFIAGKQSRKADDLPLVKQGTTYKALIKTDTADNFVQLGFYIDKEYDNNAGEGYYIMLFNGDKPKKGSHISLANYHQYHAEETGGTRDEGKALTSLEKEFALYPSQKHEWASAYYRIYRNQKPDEVPALIQKDIEELLQKGLSSETDYDALVGLYEAAKLPMQSNYFQGVRKEKYPNGKWLMHQKVQEYLAEEDIEKKKAAFLTIKKNIETNAEWDGYKNALGYFESNFIGLYAKKEMWEEYKKTVNELADKNAQASNFNNVAWGLQEKNQNLQLAEEFATFAMNQARQEIKKPSGKKPDYVTTKQWAKQRENAYCMYADTYAMVKFKRNDYKKGYDIARDIAFNYKKGKDTHSNTTYAFLAEKVIPSKELKPQLEKMVKDGSSSSEVNEILKRIYVDLNKSEAGFDAYLADLGKEIYLKKVEEIAKALISEDVPAISLIDNDGKQVTLADYKGKIVVLDFWATWCGPCISSFPGMQKVVDKYRDNPEVEILFVNTWERGDDRIKKVNEFLTNKKYTFDLLFDMDYSAAEKLNVTGIPIKFVLDQEGKIRFKSMGYHGSDIGVINEITAMIETLQARSNN